jgi:HD-like signal output (HDOD) protein
MADLQTSFQGRRFLLKNLPTLPAALQEAMRLADSPHTTVAQLAAVIERDQALAGSVLRMVNSPFYGFPGRIGSIRNSLALLGFNVIRNLIVSTMAFENMMLGSMMALWRHSVGCSIACGKLGDQLQVGHVDEFVLAGLLHDIGKVITAVQLPDAKKEIDRLVAGEDITYLAAEKRVLGIDHVRIGDWLAEHWHLPPSLRFALACHHQPGNARKYSTIATVVHIGDFLTRLFEVGDSGDDQIPLLDPYAFEHLGLNRQNLGMAIDAIGERFQQEKIASIWQAPDMNWMSEEAGMQKIPLHQATVGMVLAYGVMSADGTILAPVDSPVDGAMLRRLELAGVTKLVVRGKPVPGADMGYDARARMERLGHLFRAHEDNRFMMAWKALLHKHFMERA